MHQRRGKVEMVSSNSFTSSLWPRRLSEVVKYFTSPIWKKKKKIWWFHHLILGLINVLFKLSCFGCDINYLSSGYFFLLKANHSSIKSNANRCNKVRRLNNKWDQFKNSENLSGNSYRLHCSQDIYHGTIKTLPVGQNVSQRVVISWFLHWKVDQWHQPVDGCRVSAHIHLGMSLRYQQPVEADAPEVDVSANEYSGTFMCPIIQSFMVDLSQNSWDNCTGGSNLPWCCGAKSFPFLWVLDGD